MYNYYLLLGSNLGDKLATIHAAIQSLEAYGTVESKSSIYETEPWGKTDQPLFVNQAIHFVSSLGPFVLLEKTKLIEQNFGIKKEEKWGARALDIDILYCDDLVIHEDILKIPHQEIYQRNFALVPLMEIAGELVDPIKQLTIDELYDQCEDDKEVYLYEEEE